MNNSPKTWFGAIVLAYKTNPLRVLLIENKETGNITPIAGGTEEGETQSQTATREFFEESGIQISTEDFIDTEIDYTFTYNEKKKDRAGDDASQRIFLLNADNLPGPKETKDAKNPVWVELKDVQEKITFKDIAELIEEVFKNLQL